MLDSAADELLLQGIAAEIFGEGVWGTNTRRSRALSSVDVMRFLVRIERHFGVEVPDDELRAENFASPGAVLAMIGRHRGP